MITRRKGTDPGPSFTLTGTPDGHGRFARAFWKLMSAGSMAVAAGTDIVRLDDDGRIAKVIGFLDIVAA